MGADERRSTIRKVSEALELIEESPDLSQKVVIGQYVVLRLGEVMADVQSSAENLESANNFDQAASLREQWEWVETMLTTMREAIKTQATGNIENFNALVVEMKDAFKENLPIIKRRMLKPSDIGLQVEEETPPEPEAVKPSPVHEVQEVEIESVSVVETPPTPEQEIHIVEPEPVQEEEGDEFVSAIPLLDTPKQITLTKNVTVVVRCKNPDHKAKRKYIGIKQLVMRGASATIIGYDLDRGVALVDLHLEPDEWPDADRLNNHVVVPMSELRKPVKGG